MSVQHVNTLRYNWKKTKQWYSFLMSVFIYVENKRSLLHFFYKENINLETITAEPLLTKLTHKPFLSFAIWKTALNREIQ